ncbi:aspartate carbamoyltransferase [Candidatus Woesearchaeota archaeon]|nr:aspartate carbamoyltransferase [Candidatus Woesearchaeota archaeon]
MEPEFKTKQEIADSEFAFKGRDIVSISDLARKEIDYILDVADWFKRQHKDKNRAELEKILDGAAIASVFVEPSTRTRCSFEAAAKCLGAKAIGITDPSASSFKKGEPLKDALKMFEFYASAMGYGDAAFVMRHPLDGSARFAADNLDIPFLNGGDGKNQHPTQTLLDLFSIKETQHIIDGIHIAMVGDLKHGRTVHSLATALSMYKDVTLYFVAPEVLQMPSYIKDMLKKKEVKFATLENIEEVLDEVNITYMTRIQRERLSDEDREKVKDVYRLNAAMLKNARTCMKIMHPLPRYKKALEIGFDVDDTEHAAYYPQALNGLFVREALLALVIGRIGSGKKISEPNYTYRTDLICPNKNCISNDEFEGVKPKLITEGREGYRCYYCEARIKEGKNDKV